MYVVSLIGKDVFQGSDVICTSTRLSNIDKILAYIKQEYDVEFAEYSTYYFHHYRSFDNITDDRDITLVIEEVPTENDIEHLLSKNSFSSKNLLIYGTSN